MVLKFIDVQKSKKLKLKLQKNRLKIYYKDQILSIFTTSGITNYKQYRNAHSNSRKYRFRKTTLTRLLAKHFKWEPHYEDVVDNPYLMILPSNGTLVF
jgi:hypothetical protein